LRGDRLQSSGCMAVVAVCSEPVSPNSLKNRKILGNLSFSDMYFDSFVSNILKLYDIFVVGKIDDKFNRELSGCGSLTSPRSVHGADQ